MSRSGHNIYDRAFWPFGLLVFATANSSGACCTLGASKLGPNRASRHDVGLLLRDVHLDHGQEQLTHLCQRLDRSQVATLRAPLSLLGIRTLLKCEVLGVHVQSADVRVANLQPTKHDLVCQ